MKLLFIMVAFIASVHCRPSTISPLNVITVPPNCPEGQEWINGQCREVWKIVFIGRTPSDHLLNAANIENHNTVVVPPNCKPNQEVVNGVCRDVWKTNGVPQNVVTVPPNCAPGQILVNEQCRDVWIVDLEQSKLWRLISRNRNTYDDERQKRQLKEDTAKDPVNLERNIISVPNQCPQGYKPDALGYCREIFS